MHHPHHEKHVPSFCKRYATIGQDIHKALLEYKHEVHHNLYPTEAYNPYKMTNDEQTKFKEYLYIDKENKLVEKELINSKLKQLDEYEVVKFY
jgi:3-methyl-2-oxobutanoate hydroxymethyltransferase